MHESILEKLYADISSQKNEINSINDKLKELTSNVLLLTDNVGISNCSIESLNELSKQYSMSIVSIQNKLLDMSDKILKLSYDLNDTNKSIDSIKDEIELLKERKEYKPWYKRIF